MKTRHPFWLFLKSVPRAITRARVSIYAVAAAYLIAILVGIIMVHAGNTFALDYRDRLVNQATQLDAASQAASQGNTTLAALRDFSNNLLVGAVPKTVMGLGVVFPFPLVVYQGWVGGIVSVRSDHTSRFNDPRSATYLLLTLLLQVTPYSLAVGAGVNVGVALFRPAEHYQGKKLLGFFPIEALWDVARIYALVIPLFLLASLWEFLSRWNF